MAHVDFNNHGAAPSGHGHVIDPPGTNEGLSAAHGNRAIHIPPEDVPSAWSVLPAGVRPATPIGE